MSDAIHGYGTQFLRGNEDGPPETFTAIAEVTNISGISQEKETIEVTHLESPSKYREFISGLRDAGEVTIDLNFIPDGTSFANLKTDFEADVARSYQIIWPDTASTTVTFEGHVTALPPEAPVDDKLSISVTFKVTGVPTWTP